MRKLIYVPIVHSEVDMGSAAKKLKDRYIVQYGLKKWRAHLKEIAALWTDIRERLLALHLDFSRLKVYQDGLPVCGREVEIARELAEEESPNYRLVIELVERGAQLVGTEDPQLLLEEYKLVQAGSGGSKKPAVKPEHIMARRDEFIARRIDQTLRLGETGVLFIGAFHKVNERLAKDIEVRYLR